MAKPVVASAFEDAQRLIVEGETGFLFQPSEKNSLKKSLIKAFVSQNLFCEMGNKARQEIEANHSWTNRVQVLIQESDRILTKKI